MRQNRLTQITVAMFEGLDSLSYLRLDENLISHVDSRSFGVLDKLVYLVLRANPIGGNLARIQFSSPYMSYVDMSECGLVGAMCNYVQVYYNFLSFAILW